MSGKDKSKILRPKSASVESLLRALNTKLKALNYSIVSDDSSYEIEVIEVETSGFPYTIPDKKYTSVTIVVPEGETVDFNGVTLPENITINASGNGTRTCKSFTLSNPSATPSNVLIIASN